MTYERLLGMPYQERINILGKCGKRVMTLSEYVEGGWLDTKFNREEDFKFKDGGYLYVARNDSGEDDAYFVEAHKRRGIHKLA